MKTPKSLEETMRAWTPRRPAEEMEARLFGKQPPALRFERARANLPWYQTLGASIAGCAVALFTIMNFIHLGATHSISAQFGPLSNHVSSLALASAPINTWTAPILGWTNDGTVGSSIRPFELLNTNTILP